MPPPGKSPLEDFFKPYGRTFTTIPQKRASPSSAADDEDTITVRSTVYKTPAKSVKFKDVTPQSGKSLLFSPRSQGSLPIRSPKPQASPSPSKPKQTRLFEDTDKPKHSEIGDNISFSFSDVSERSHKVFEGGKVVAVRDSDDDTDSLESLEDIFGRKQDIVTTSDSSPPEDTEAERVRTLSMYTSGRSVPIVGKDKLRALYAKDRVAKFDLSGVLNDHFDDQEVEQKIKTMRQGMEGNDSEDDDHLDKDLLASVIRTRDADEEDVDRLLNAVERTEALSTNKEFAFFKPNSRPKSRSSKQDSFPRSAIPDQLWTPKDKEARDRAYLSGYMAELASLDELADEALTWTFDQLVKEPSVELRHAYIRCLKAGSKSWTRLNLTAADIQSVFLSLGADTDCLRDATSIQAKYHPIQEPSGRDYQYLHSVLQTFQGICADMDFPAISKLSSIILRLALDKSVMCNNRMCLMVESLMEALLSISDEELRGHVHDRILHDAMEHLHDPVLQCQLLSRIPSTFHEAINLRKTLADVFLLGASVVDPSTKTSNASMAELSNHISKSTVFSTSRHANSPPIDYAVLTSLTHILNVAVSSGNPPVESDIDTKSSLEEKEFNATVDELADRLHNFFVSIKDTGASHMRRTEAKDALQALYFRLLFSVRTKVRKKKHVFDSNGEMKGGAFKGRWVSGEEWREKERGGEFMKKFLVKRDSLMG